MHPISQLQGALVTALKADAALVAIAGADRVFDAAPNGRPAPYVVIVRHDVIQRDGDSTPGQEHRLLLHCWGDQPSRKRALDMAERVVAVAGVFAATGIVVTHREHVRTETVIDKDTGLARAAVFERVEGGREGPPPNLPLKRGRNSAGGWAPLGITPATSPSSGRFLH